MTKSYANITFLHADAEFVAKAVADMHRFVVISPVDRGCVVVYDRESDVNGELIVDLARILSEQLESVALAVINHEDSVLLYWLFSAGDEIDTYISRPDYFDGEPMNRGGEVNAIQEVFDQGDSSRENLDRILHGDVGSSVLVAATDRHRELADALNLSRWAVGFGYTRLAEDEFPDGFPADDTFYTEPG